MNLYKELEQITFPEGVNITVNNLPDAKSGVLRQYGQVKDISLAHCYTLADAVREPVGLLAEEPGEQAG